MKHHWEILGIIALILAGWRPSRAQPPTRLQEQVTVAADTIHLSDLLPADAPAVLRNLATVISLGHAPNAGSARIFSLDQIKQIALLHTGLAQQLLIPAQVVATRKTVPIPPATLQMAIASALRARGWTENWLPTELQIPQEARSSGTPSLTVRNLTWDPRQLCLNIKFHCAPAKNGCGDFLVRAFAPQHPSSRLEGVLRRPEIIGAVHPAIDVKSGQTAILTLRSGSMVLHFPVICLQRGKIGDTIRARDPTSHRVFRGAIESAGKLLAVTD